MPYEFVEGGQPRLADIHYFFVVDTTPVGEAPVEVREQWLGLALPVRYPRRVESPDPQYGVGVASGTPMLVHDGIRVSFPDCIRALSRARRSGAAAYWEVANETRPIAYLVFEASEGRLLPADVARRLHPELDDIT